MRRSCNYSCTYLERLGARGERGVTNASSSRVCGTQPGISADGLLKEDFFGVEKSGRWRRMSFTAAPHSDPSSGLCGIGDSLWSKGIPTGRFSPGETKHDIVVTRGKNLKSKLS
jgi:hypothetical protein